MKYRYFFSSHCNITTAHLALIIDSISIPVKDSINTRALAHERVLVHKYSKVKSENFTKHVQSVLTRATFYIVNLRGHIVDARRQLLPQAQVLEEHIGHR